MGVPTLEEVLTLPANVFELELRVDGTEALDAVLAVVDAAGVFDRVKFTGWNQALLTRLKRQRPSATVGLFSGRPDTSQTPSAHERSVLDAAERSGFDIAHVAAGSITPSFAGALRALGYGVHAADAATQAHFSAALKSSVDSLTVDDATAAVAALTA